MLPVPWNGAIEEPYNNILGIDPEFTDPENMDFSLTENSPANGYGCQTFGEKIYSKKHYKTLHYSKHIRNNEHVTGTISENTIWNADTIYVDSDLTIADETHLEIEPGTNVIFTGFYKFNVEGTISAIGLPESRITFTSQNPESFEIDTTETGAWQGFFFDNIKSTNSSSIFKFCDISHTKNLDEDYWGGAFTIRDFSKLKIINSKIHNNLAYNGGAFGIDCASSPHLINNIITDNYCLNLGSAFYILYSYPRILNNTIVNNSSLDEDEFSHSSAINLFNSKPVLKNNIIRENPTFFFEGTQIENPKDFYISYNNIEVYEEENNNIDSPTLWNNDFSILENSPEVDRGTLEFADYIDFPTTDFLGNERVYNSLIDMGAIEFNGNTSGNEVNYPESSHIKNYPNPFGKEKNSTCFEFELKRNSVKPMIQIFNIKGQLLDIIKLNTRSGKINWSPENISSGVYFYRLSDKNNTYRMQKLIYIK